MAPYASDLDEHPRLRAGVMRRPLSRWSNKGGRGNGPEVGVKSGSGFGLKALGAGRSSVQQAPFLMCRRRIPLSQTDPAHRPHQ